MEITAPKKLQNINVHSVLATTSKILIVGYTILKNYTYRRVYVVTLLIGILFVGSTTPEM